MFDTLTRAEMHKLFSLMTGAYMVCRKEGNRDDLTLEEAQGLSAVLDDIDEVSGDLFDTYRKRFN
jgi:hypothetical protein